VTMATRTPNLEMRNRWAIAILLSNDHKIPQS
jgi:hypothetical protein